MFPCFPRDGPSICSISDYYLALWCNVNPVKVPETDIALRLNSLGRTPAMVFTHSGRETPLGVRGPEPCLTAAAEAPLRAVGRAFPLGQNERLGHVTGRKRWPA